MHISGQTSMQDYLTMPKTILKTEENAHIFHQQLQQQKTENSPGNSAKKQKIHRSKQETIHSPANATNKHINCDQGSKEEVSKKCSGLYSVLSQKVQRTRQKFSTRAHYIGFSVVGMWKVFYASVLIGPVIGPV